MEKIIIKVPSENYSVVGLYDAVAKEMGYLTPDKLQYDCCKINVAKNIQDGFYDYYCEAAMKEDPTASEMEIRMGITCILVVSGPKVNKELANNEVEVFEGFIC